MNRVIEMKREERLARLWDWLDAPELGRWFEGLRPWFRDEDQLRIEQELTDDTMMIRAEMPGIDPAKDVEITVADGVLHIRAERRSESKADEEGRTRSEFRYGSFAQAVRVPKDMNADDETATYKDGILEVRFPPQGADRGSAPQGHSLDVVAQDPVRRAPMATDAPD